MPALGLYRCRHDGCRCTKRRSGCGARTRSSIRSRRSTSVATASTSARCSAAEGLRIRGKVFAFVGFRGRPHASSCPPPVPTSSSVPATPSAMVMRERTMREWVIVRPDAPERWASAHRRGVRLRRRDHALSRARRDNGRVTAPLDSARLAPRLLGQGPRPLRSRGRCPTDTRPSACSSSRATASARSTTCSSPGIPDKGVLLTTLSLWWFDRLAGGDGGRSIPNHLARRAPIGGLRRTPPTICSALIPAEVVGRAMVVQSLDDAADRVRGARLPHRVGLGRVPGERHGVRHPRCPTGLAERRPPARADLHPGVQGADGRARREHLVRADGRARRRRARRRAARPLARDLRARRRDRRGARADPRRHEVRVRHR